VVVRLVIVADGMRDRKQPTSKFPAVGAVMLKELVVWRVLFVTSATAIKAHLSTVIVGASVYVTVMD
jgi:hypothetical protein